MPADQTDHPLMETSLEALVNRYDGMAAELFDQFIADHPHYAHVFLNPEAARERMTRETLEAMLGLAAGEWWVDHAVTNFIDLHHNYAEFTAEDYAAWFALVIAAMAKRAGPDWPEGASAAWQRQADGLVAKVATIARNNEVPQRPHISS